MMRSVQPSPRIDIEMLPVPGGLGGQPPLGVALPVGPSPVAVAMIAAVNTAFVADRWSRACQYPTWPPDPFD